jgi:hypothetical protein
MCVSSPVPSTLVFGAVDVLLFCSWEGWPSCASAE